MAQIPDFTSEAFNDLAELKKVLTSVLQDINKDANKLVRPNLGKNVVLSWVDDGVTPLPDGYERANGRDGTFDANNSNIIFIQKVR